MGVNPETGLYELDRNLQPTGAMGAVTSLLNAQKAQEIADTLQQQRSAQAQHESDLAEEYRRASEESEQAKAAQAALGPNATLEERIGVAAQYANPKDWLPQMTRYSTADLASQRKLEGVDLTSGRRLTGVQTHEGMTVRDPITGEPTQSPVAGARAAELGARAGKETAQGEAIPLLTQSQIELNKSKGGMYTSIGRYKQAQASVAGKSKLSASEVKNLVDWIKSDDKKVADKTKRNKYGQAPKLTPEDQAGIEETLKERKVLADAVMQKAGIALPSVEENAADTEDVEAPPQKAAPKPGTAAPASIAPAVKAAPAATQKNSLGLNLPPR